MKDNPYKHLCKKADGLPDGPIREYKSTTIFYSNHESITMLTSEPQPGRIYIGYLIYLQDGHTTNRLPNPAYGYCETQQAALLYFLGYLLSWSRRFSREAVDSFLLQIKQNAQTSMF